MRAVPLVVAGVVALGCEPTRVPPPAAKPEHYTQLNPSPRPLRARTPETVALYRTQAPTERFVEVAELSDSGSDRGDALEHLKLSAAGVGCDALIIGEPRVDSVVATGFGAAAGSYAAAGTCIMFVDDPGTWRPDPHSVVCISARAQISEAKDPAERVRLAHSIPPECHRE